MNIELSTLSNEDLQRGLTFINEVLAVIPSVRGLDNLQMRERYEGKAQDFINEIDRRKGQNHFRRNGRKTGVSDLVKPALKRARVKCV